MLKDSEIEALVGKHPDMIVPFVNHQVREHGGRRVISYGLSSAGYDIRLGLEAKIFTPVHCHLPVDPKNFDPRLLTDVHPSMEDGSFVIPPHSYLLGCSVERFAIPDDVKVTCLGKSTYARSAIHVNVTPLEPGWEGVLTIEVSNASPCPVKLYANEGIAQLEFYQLSGPARVSYRDRKGKYQSQEGVVPPRL